MQETESQKESQFETLRIQLNAMNTGKDQNFRLGVLW